jgi:predicted transcriptional regulator
LSQSLIARVETGAVDPRLSTLSKILNAIIAPGDKRRTSDVMHSPVILVEATDTVRRAVELMEKGGLSQMPVLEGGKVVGSIQETTLIRTMLGSKEPQKVFESSLRNVMEECFPIVGPTASIDDVLALFTRDKPAVLVMDRGKIVGIITKIDVISAIKHGK